MFLRGFAVGGAIANLDNLDVNRDGSPLPVDTLENGSIPVV